MTGRAGGEKRRGRRGSKGRNKVQEVKAENKVEKRKEQSWVMGINLAWGDAVRLSISQVICTSSRKGEARFGRAFEELGPAEDPVVSSKQTLQHICARTSHVPPCETRTAEKAERPIARERKKVKGENDPSTRKWALGSHPGEGKTW
ncbi:hypothetical protein C8R47DRAFT_1084790 [Mycena vitilis]|nr:hypothetical protein C8R47DRAFT_1084790 [Mycena vitilis]